MKENEGHGFQKQENKIEFYTKMEKFLARCLKQSITNKVWSTQKLRLEPCSGFLLFWIYKLMWNICNEIFL